MKVNIILRSNGSDLATRDIVVDDESSDGIREEVLRLVSESVICTGDTIHIEEVE